ncbi:hypothetical protein AB0Y20_01575 [Heyndrickxia oleronia]|uniref:hypothetical protein n=1 Tax=Heyndrickxia oleronia TaxID=38875 RepID=UPI003F1ED449
MKLKITLQNQRKELFTEVENFDPVTFVEETKKIETVLIPIGNLIVNKHHIEYITPVDEETVV